MDCIDVFGPAKIRGRDLLDGSGFRVFVLYDQDSVILDDPLRRPHLEEVVSSLPLKTELAPSV